MKNTFEYLMSLPPVGEVNDYHQSRSLLLDIASKAVTVDGIICEFGVYKGESARNIIKNFPDTEIYLFDSFDGLPEDWHPGRDKGSYAVDSVPVFTEKNVHVMRGWFDDTLNRFSPTENISLLHIDCDIYSSTKTVFRYCDDFIVPGTIILFDELYNYKYYKDHEYKAFLEWAEYTESNFEYIGRSAGTQACVRVVD